MKVLDVVKLANGLVIGSGTGAIAREVVKKVTPEELGKATKASMVWASSAIAGATAFVATQHMNEQIDEMVEGFKSIFTKKTEEVEETEEPEAE